MKSMILYDYLDNFYRQEQHKFYSTFRHKKYAREIMRSLNFPEEDYRQPLERALHACRALGIVEANHFCHVFCFGDEYIYEDFSLSEFGTYLFIINCDPSNPIVARAQLFH